MHLPMAEAAPKIDARMVRTQQALRTAFLTLIERKSLDDISIRDIVAEAGIGQERAARGRGRG